MDDISAWFPGRMPSDWFVTLPKITADREEILVVGDVGGPDFEVDEADARAAEAGRISRFREETRGVRMHIAEEAELRFGRKVAWGAVCGQTRVLFTSLAVPVMTRLRQPERSVLDTLVEAGIARSRADALSWCVRLVGKHQAEWIEDLRGALVAVQRARAAGPAT
ncbi:MAG TPA: hypothetical protein VHV82_14355 [Sporichthyaceae bacterium]|nr:hypothetical protein [Sporichthyaceae bacterium]